MNWAKGELAETSKSCEALPAKEKERREGERVKEVVERDNKEVVERDNNESCWKRQR